MKPIWYVKHPTFQYCEDTKAIAKKRGLKIVDSRFKDEMDQCKDAPTLTLCGDSEASDDLPLDEGCDDKDNSPEGQLDALKEEADELGVAYRQNIGYDTLFERVKEAKG